VPTKPAVVKFGRGPLRLGGEMSESQPTDLTSGYVDSMLRDRQLRLVQAIDLLILDGSHTLADTLRFTVTETQRALDAVCVDILFEYANGRRIEISSDQTRVGMWVAYHTRQLSTVAAELVLDEQTIGIINVEGHSGKVFGESHLDFVKAMASHISVAISHAALTDEDNFRTATDKLLFEATRRDSDVVMRQLLDDTVSALNSLAFVRPDAAQILFADSQDDHSLVVAYSTNSADIGVLVDIESSICGEAFRCGSTVLVPRAIESPGWRPVLKGTRCEMAIPITVGVGTRFPLGVLNLESSHENAFSAVGQILAMRFSRRLINAIAMTKIRADIDGELADQLMVMAADQVLNAVHRINNQVGSVRAIATDLLEDLDSSSAPDPGDVAARLRMIIVNAEKTLEIPEKLRRRIGTLQESADVNAQVEAGLATVRIPKSIELMADLTPGLPSIPCTALDLVVENLVLNAVKAMQNKPGSLSVSTWLDQRLPREPFIVITVRDTGVGMTRQEIERMFEPGQAGRRDSGLGFGMTWVRSWVRRSQGLIDIESEPGVGTTVNIRFQVGPQAIDQSHEEGDMA
jgi:signal transduction histidine kinase